MAQALGVIASLLGIFNFIIEKTAPSPSPETVIHIGAALDNPRKVNATTNAGGFITNIWTYNGNEDGLGNVINARLEHGDTIKVKIHQENTQQAQWVKIRGDDDAVCIAAITVIWAADTGEYAWVGDWAKHCGLEWGYSNYYIDNSERRPFCFWLGTDARFSTRTVMIHLPSFKPDTDDAWKNGNGDDYCKKDRLRVFDRDDERFEMVPKNDTEPTKEKDPASMAWRALREDDDRLIITSNKYQSAKELCESPTARSPSLVSLTEGLYCNMETSELLPLCGGEVQEGCFDVDEQMERHSRERMTAGPMKKYSEVMKWG